MVEVIHPELNGNNPFKIKKPYTYEELLDLTAESYGFSHGESTAKSDAPKDTSKPAVTFVDYPRHFGRFSYTPRKFFE